MAIQETLNDREQTYGDFGKLAAAIQAFKDVYRKSPSWAKMTAVQREALDADAVKTCRILYGDPQHEDNWHDKAGYAILATEEFTRNRVQEAHGAPADEQLEAPVPEFLGK
jgi:hypothetical protein